MSLPGSAEWEVDEFPMFKKDWRMCLPSPSQQDGFAEGLQKQWIALPASCARKLCVPYNA